MGHHGMVRDVAPRRGNKMFLVVVFGRVATGKSTLTDQLHGVLPAVTYRKDEIKEIAFETLGTGDRTFSQALGRFSIELCLRQTVSAVSSGIPCVLEGNFRTQTIERLLTMIPGSTTCILVRCDAADHTVLSRFVARAESGMRHVGHNDDDLMAEYRSRIPDRPEWPVGNYERIDYEAGVDDAVATAAAIRSRLTEGRGND
jgi:predicted kinase